MLALQAFGVSLLCGCGLCPISWALGIETATEQPHACCAGTQSAAQKTDEEPQTTQIRNHCGLCDHALTDQIATAASRVHADSLAFVAQAVLAAAWLAVAPMGECGRAKLQAMPRGPPVCPPFPIVIQHIRLLV